MESTAQTRSVGVGSGAGALAEEEEEEELVVVAKSVVPLRERPGRTRAPSRDTFDDEEAAANADRRRAQDSGVVATIWLVFGRGGKRKGKKEGRRRRSTKRASARRSFVSIQSFLSFFSSLSFSYHQRRLHSSFGRRENRGRPLFFVRLEFGRENRERRRER